MTHAVRRFHIGARYSEIAVHHGTVYLAGQVADDATQDIRGQTQQVLDRIASLLAEAKSDNAHILMAQVYLADMADYEGMNEVWEDWIEQTAPGDAPPRATVQARLARAEWRIEVVVTAALT
jgi:enamine deaminase RidA (YjgF/YER057c/UK114 family)